MPWAPGRVQTLRCIDLSHPPEQRAATVYRAQHEPQVHGPGDTLDLSDAVPDLVVSVAELFG